VLLDTETSGLFSGARVIELCVMDSGATSPQINTLLNPGPDSTLPSCITDLTGITPAMLADPSIPSFAAIYPELLKHTSGKIIVAHNATFDSAHIRYEINTARLQGQLPNTWLCTLKLARWLLPGIGHSLNEVCKHYGIHNHAAHRAAGDVIATGAILIRLLEEAKTRHGITTLQGLQKCLVGPEVPVDPISVPAPATSTILKKKMRACKCKGTWCASPACGCKRAGIGCNLHCMCVYAPDGCKNTFKKVPHAMPAIEEGGSGGGSGKGEGEGEKEDDCPPVTKDSFYPPHPLLHGTKLKHKLIISTENEQFVREVLKWAINHAAETGTRITSVLKTEM